MDARAAPLADRVVLVTGGARRVGAAISSHLGGLGARVVVHFHQSRVEAERLVARLPAGGVALPGDLATEDGAADLFAALDRLAIRPDALVHAAASFERGGVEVLTPAHWDRVHALNLRAFALLAHEVARRRESGDREGCLVAIGDAAGHELWPGYLAHSVAKAGLLALVQALAKSLAPGIRVNAVVPGPVLPPDGTPPAQVERYRRRTLLGRLGRAEQVAQAVAFLLTCDFTTGSIVSVTGGSELWRGEP